MKTHSEGPKQIDERFFRGVDPDFAKRVLPFLKGLHDHYFRCHFEGWENIHDGPALYVGNHNGLLTFEVLMMFYAWWIRFEGKKQALGLAHGVALNNPFFNWLIPRIGAIPASPEYADEAFRRQFSLLVYPGGEKECFRPYHERKKVDFYQRKGFIKVALRNAVPVVPVVSIGAHESYVILHRGEEIAEKLGLKERYRLHGFPITFRSLFFLWCVSTGMLTFFPLLLAPAALTATFIPLPAKMDFKIMPAIHVKQLWKSHRTDEENYQIIYDYIVNAMQEELMKGYENRKFPIIG